MSASHLSRLLSLPAELRDEIYRAVLLELEPVMTKALPREPALLAACKQIRNEALSIYYGENSFVIHFPETDNTIVKNHAKQAVAWLHNVPEDGRARIKTLLVELATPVLGRKPMSQPRIERWLYRVQERWYLQGWSNTIAQHVRLLTETGVKLDVVQFCAPYPVHSMPEIRKLAYREAAEYYMREEGLR